MMERVASALVERLDRTFTKGTVRASVVDGDKAGYWLEIEAGPWLWTASDINGEWGVTTYAAEKTMIATNPTPDEFTTDDGRTVYWWSNREDGPTTDNVDEIVEYLMGAM